MRQLELFASFAPSTASPTSPYGKTSPEPSPLTVGETLLRSSTRWSTSGRVTLRGESWTAASSESPSVAVECSLSQILEANAPSKYWLSPKACAGILRRAAKRGKELPRELERALESVAQSPASGPRGGGLETTNHDYSRADGFTAVAFNWQEGPGGSLGMSDADTGGSPPVRVHQTLAVALTDGSPSDTVGSHADAKETDTVKALRNLLNSIGAEAFAEWGFGILASFFEEEILQQALHGSGFCKQGVRRYELVSYAREGKETGATRFVREMWQDGRKGCPSCRWQPHEQRALQLATYLQRLSQPGAQASQVLHDLRSAAKGAWVLRPSLSTVPEMGQSTDGQGQRLCACSIGVGEQSDQVMQCVRVFEAISCKELLLDASSTFASGKSVVRRLTVKECEFLQGFPRNWTSEGITKEGKRIQMADAPRYRQLGNAVTVNVAHWIANNLVRVYTAAKESADA